MKLHKICRGPLRAVILVMEAHGTRKEPNRLIVSLQFIFDFCVCKSTSLTVQICNSHHLSSGSVTRV